MVTTLPPLRVIVIVRCPRSRPSCSMSALVASETRSPFSTSSEMRMLARRAKSGSDEQSAELVAIQGDGVRLVIDARTAGAAPGGEWRRSSAYASLVKPRYRPGIRRARVVR
jgi:hypothetical protein